jgi:hypothetical protein
VKEPGAESQIHQIHNIPVTKTVDWLVAQASKVCGIPLENLCLVYGGKLLLKQKNIADYHLQNKGVVYAVDTRKYSKKVTKEYCFNRINEVKRIK